MTCHILFIPPGSASATSRTLASIYMVADLKGGGRGRGGGEEGKEEVEFGTIPQLSQ